MVAFLLFVLSTVGLTNILVHGRIMDVIGLRDFARKYLKKIDADGVLDCYECMGFWSGLFTGAIFFAHFSWYVIPLVLACGWAGSLLSSTYNEVMYILRANVQFDLGEDNGEEQ